MHLNISKLKDRTEQIAHCQNDEFYEKWWLLLCHIAHQYESGTIPDLEAGLLSFTFPEYVPIKKLHISNGVKVNCRKFEVKLFESPQIIKMKWKVFDYSSQEVFLFNDDIIALPNNTVYKFEQEY